MLATPIEAILGNPVDAPHARTAARDAGARQAARRAADDHRAVAAPRQRGAAGGGQARAGRCSPRRPGPLGSFPVQTLRPGSAFGVGYASGDIAASAIGTVTYIDGDRVWGFGHPLDGVGARALLLQDAYVFRVINNPVAIPGVAGDVQVRRDRPRHRDAQQRRARRASSAASARCRHGPGAASSRPISTPARSARVITNVADEAAVDQPTGSSILSFMAPLAVTQAAGHGARRVARAAHRPRLLRDLVQGAQAAGALLQPLRDRRRRTRSAPATWSRRRRARTSSSALALVDALQGVRRPRHRRRGQRRRSAAASARRTCSASGCRAAAGPGTRAGDAHAAPRARAARAAQGAPAAARPTCGPGKRRVVFTGADVDPARAAWRSCSAVRARLRPRQPRRRPRARATCAGSSAQIEGSRATTASPRAGRAATPTTSTPASRPTATRTCASPAARAATIRIRR